jgi:hypothetical protein
LNSLYSYDDTIETFNEAIPDTSEKYAVLSNKMVGSSDIPCGREQFVMEEYGGNLLVFGGRVAWENSVWESSSLERMSNPSINDVWRYNINNNHWTCLFPLSESSVADVSPKGLTPSSMSGSASVIVDRYLYIFGGRFTNGSLSSQLWAFDITGRIWNLCSGCLYLFVRRFCLLLLLN